MDNIEYVKMTLEEREALRRVIAHFWEDESKDFQGTPVGSPEKETHIFRELCKLEAVLSRPSDFTS